MCWAFTTFFIMLYISLESALRKHIFQDIKFKTKNKKKKKKKKMNAESIV